MRGCLWSFLFAIILWVGAMYAILWIVREFSR